MPWSPAEQRAEAAAGCHGEGCGWTVTCWITPSRSERTRTINPPPTQTRSRPQFPPTAKRDSPRMACASVSRIPGWILRTFPSVTPDAQSTSATAIPQHQPSQRDSHPRQPPHRSPRHGLRPPAWSPSLPFRRWGRKFDSTLSRLLQHHQAQQPEEEHGHGDRGGDPNLLVIHGHCRRGCRSGSLCLHRFPPLRRNLLLRTKKCQQTLGPCRTRPGRRLVMACALPPGQGLPGAARAVQRACRAFVPARSGAGV